jgi:hypothetical protein
VNKATSIVEINGNRYDAVSGQLIGAVKKAAYHAIKPTQGLSIDGFTRRRAAKALVLAKRSVHEQRRHPEHSKTLMRSTVKKPARAKSEDKIKSRGLSPDHARADRASRVPKSSSVERFGAASGRSSKAKIGEVIAPNPKLPVRTAAAATASLPSIMADASHHKLERLLDYALAHADAHKKSLDDDARAKRKVFGRLPRWLVIGLVITALVTIAGFVLWRVVPGASFKLAATKAHVNAKMPTPISGYRIGPISSSQNAVTTTIQSTSDSAKKYTVTEQTSNQPAASLAASAATGSSGGSAQVQTVQDQDKTYILSQDGNKSTAVCIKGNNTVSVEAVDLNVAQLLEAIKDACKGL